MTEDIVLTEESLIATVDHKFWIHMTTKTLLPFDLGLADRREFLGSLCERIIRMEYVPGAPRGYIVSSKANGVARFLPAFTLEDSCVYYFCVRQLEPEIAKNRTPGTFGGFQLGNQLRRQEDEEAANDAVFDPDYAPEFSYNRFGWIREWSAYQKHALDLYRSGDYKYFAMFDIANFYDVIQIDLLETSVRAVSTKEQTAIVNLLFYFLRNCNRRYPAYSPRSQGLPQDEAGDCSRILANFYLQDYDARMKEICESLGARYLRYADDQIVATTDETTAKEVQFRASKELMKLGLNLNAHKVRNLEREVFAEYWAFDIMSHLLGEQHDVNEAFRMFQQRRGDDTEFRDTTILKRFLSMTSAEIAPYILEIMEIITSPTEITKFDSRHCQNCMDC
jgi:hypothetical protein